MTDPSNIPDSPDPENQDDEVIGQAFQKSVRFLGILVLLAAGLWFLSNYEPSAEPVESGPEVPIRPVSHDGTVSAPPLPFEDITLSAGIDFTHDDGARGKKLLPETMGSGCAFVDVDSDGDSDILLASGRPWKWTSEKPADSTLRLWLNDGNGQFVEASREWRLEIDAYCTGLAVGDVDGDGDQDVFVAAVGSRPAPDESGGSLQCCRSSRCFRRLRRLVEQRRLLRCGC